MALNTGYRCRHGHSSARPTSPDRPRNLYLREDTLIGALAQRLATNGSASAVVEHLRSQAMVIVHDRAGGRLAAHDDC